MQCIAVNFKFFVYSILYLCINYCIHKLTHNQVKVVVFIVLYINMWDLVFVSIYYVFWALASKLKRLLTN